MAHNMNWDIENYREEHESDEQWELRRAFMLRWKDDYPEERLVCLARVFANIEFMGCRYPPELMMEVTRLSDEVAKAKSYRQNKRTKLQRTFVSASDAAEDRARGVKRSGGVVVEVPPKKSTRIPFVPQSGNDGSENVIDVSDSEDDDKVEKIDVADEDKCADENKLNKLEQSFSTEDSNEYLKEMQSIKCLNINKFRESMFSTSFGRLVLIMRPWSSKITNIQASCAACGIKNNGSYDSGCYSIVLNGTLIASATGSCKAEAKSAAEMLAWNRLREECVSIVVKEQFLTQGERISADHVTERKAAIKSEQFGTPVENNVAIKMMKLMGWTGGGLGADSQGIAEPIKPHLQMVKRAGLGSGSSDLRQLCRAVSDLIQRYKRSDCLDLDLVFAADFAKEERSELHQLARRSGLQSKSYGKGDDRFLVVRKKLDLFCLVKAILEKGGSTPKYQVFIPEKLSNR